MEILLKLRRAGRLAALVFVGIALAACGNATPELDAMQAFMNQKTETVEACARARVLALQAHDLLRANPQPDAVAQQLVEQYQGALPAPAQRARLREIMLAQSKFALMFHDLDRDTVAIAYPQTCRYTVAYGIRPDFSGREWLAQMDKAAQCEKQHEPGVRRQECVAGAFRPGQG